ncbi:MAG: MATE family efflux transporter [Clostridia bacterium]
MNTLSRKFNFFTLIKFTAPTIVMMILMSLYTMVDGVFVSNIVGETALSAINIVYPVISLVVAVAIMFATGSSAIIANEMGKGNNAKAKNFFSFIIYFGIIIGLIFSVFGTIFLDDITRLMGATIETEQFCKDYLLIIIFASPFAILQMMFEFLFVTAGKPKLGLISTFLGGVANVILDLFFMGYLNMGIKGAALGTAIGYCIPAFFGLIYFTFSRKGCLYLIKPKMDFKSLLKTCANGSSEMVTNLATSVTVFLFNMVMLKFLGVDGVVAITIVLYSQFFLTAVFLGFSSGVAPIISYNHGSKNTAQLKNVIKISSIFIIIISILTFVLSLAFSGIITSIFVKSDSNVFEIAKNGFLLFSISYLFIGVNIFTSSMFTALSNGFVSALISFLRTFLFLIVSIIVLPQIIGENGVWLAIPLAEILTLFVSIFFFIKNIKKEIF